MTILVLVREYKIRWINTTLVVVLEGPYNNSVRIKMHQFSRQDLGAPTQGKEFSHPRILIIVAEYKSLTKIQETLISVRS